MASAMQVTPDEEEGGPAAGTTQPSCAPRCASHETNDTNGAPLPETPMVHESRDEAASVGDVLARAVCARAAADAFAKEASAHATRASALRLAAALAAPLAERPEPPPEAVMLKEKKETVSHDTATTLASPPTTPTHDDSSGAAPPVLTAPAVPRPRKKAKLALLSDVIVLLDDAGASAAAAEPLSLEQKAHAPRRACVSCGAVKTPQWRSGPAGSKTLCNACGTRLMRIQTIAGTMDM